MDPVTISTWMKYKYDPNGMFCILEDQKIVACLQTKERTLHYEGKKCKALILSLACTLPDYRQRHYFSQLMEAAMNYANCNHMLTLCYTNFPKILEAKSFQNVSKTKYYWLEMENWLQGDLKNVRTYRPEMNLFQFIQNSWNILMAASFKQKRVWWTDSLLYQLQSSYRNHVWWRYLMWLCDL